MPLKGPYALKKVPFLGTHGTDLRKRGETNKETNEEEEERRRVPNRYQ